MSLRNILIPQAVIDKLNVPQIEDIADQLPINPLYTWFTMPTRIVDGKQIAGPRRIEDITTIVVHHTGMAKSMNLTASSHAKSHINTKFPYAPKGEPGIPYHGYVKDGKPYQTNDLLAFTYGVPSNNWYTVHIAVEGDYHNFDTLTDPDRNALYALILAYKDVLPNASTIRGHGEIVPTQCPGMDMNRIRDDMSKFELTLKSQEEPDRQKKMYLATEQHRYLFNQYATDPTANKWLEPKLLKMYEVMKEYGMFFD